MLRLLISARHPKKTTCRFNPIIIKQNPGYAGFYGLCGFLLAFVNVIYIGVEVYFS